MVDLKRKTESQLGSVTEVPLEPCKVARTSAPLEKMVRACIVLWEYLTAPSHWHVEP